MRRSLIRLLSFATALAVVAAVSPSGLTQDADPEAGPERYSIDGFLDRKPPEAVAIDPADEMRRLVERIAEVARRRDPSFIIVAEDGLELILKPAPDGMPAPARAFLQAIDGLFVHDVVALPAHDPRNSDDRMMASADARARQARLVLAKQALAEGVIVFAMAETRRERQKDALKWADGQGLRAVFGPPFVPGRARPPRPWGESARAVRALTQVRTVLRIAGDLGDAARLTADAKRSNHDAIVIAPFHRTRPLLGDSVKALKQKRAGARRLVLARIDVGRAARWRWYWQESWTAGNPPWIAEPVDNDPDRFHVRYWQAGWRKIVVDGERAYLKALMDLGYDGVVLTGLDGYRFFESG